MWSDKYSIMEESEKCDILSVAKVFNALKLTPKGKLHYDRDPKSPPPFIPKYNRTAEDGFSPSEPSTKSPLPISQPKCLTPTKALNYDKIHSDHDRKIQKELSKENLIYKKTNLSSNDSLAERSTLMPSINLNPLQLEETMPFKKENIQPLAATYDGDKNEIVEDDDHELCRKLPEHWSIGEKEAIVVLERISLLNMETMRKKGQEVDNALTAMELKRRARVQKRLDEKEYKMLQKSVEQMKKAKEAYIKNIEKYHQREKALQEEEERQSLKLQKKLDEIRVRQQEEHRLSKQQRDDRLQQELKIAAEQQLLLKKKQEEARLIQEAEVKKKVEEEKLRNLEISRSKAINSATHALRLYSETLPGSDDALTQEESEAYLVNTLGISLDVVNTPIVAEIISRLSTADDALVVEEETTKLEKCVDMIHNVIEGLTSAKKNATEKKLLENKLSEESAFRDVAENSTLSLQENQNRIARDLQVTHNAMAPQISKSNLDRYSQIKALKITFSDRIVLLEERTGSQLKNIIRKKVNIPVNAIAATNSEHMKDKLTKLRELLSGNLNIQEATDLQLANDYAKNLLAVKFVKQGEVEVSNKRVADEGFQGFAYAAIISGKYVFITY